MQHQIKQIHTCSANSLVGESTRQSGFFPFEDLPFRLFNTCIIAGTPNAKVLPDPTIEQINIHSTNMTIPRKKKKNRKALKPQSRQKLQSTQVKKRVPDPVFAIPIKSRPSNKKGQA